MTTQCDQTYVKVREREGEKTDNVRGDGREEKKKGEEWCMRVESVGDRETR